MAIFTFVVEFRGGTYCSQVEANDVIFSLPAWLEKVAEQQKEIKHLGRETIKELKVLIARPDYKPIELSGLRKVWYTGYYTRKGVFRINIIQTNVT